MRPICSTLLALIAVSSALPAADSSITTAQVVHDVSLPTLIARPDALTTSQVRFRAVVCGLTDIYDRDHSWFRPELYANLSVWDERAALWDAEVRGTPVNSLYINRDRMSVALRASLTTYRLVEVVGRIREVVDGRPMIDVLTIEPVPGGQDGWFSDAVISRIEQAVALAADGSADLAEVHYAAAFESELPPHAVVLLGIQRARNLMVLGRHAEALAQLERSASAMRGLPGLEAPRRAQVLVQQARCVSALANRGQASRSTAIALAREALAIDPAEGEAYAVLGIALAGSGQLDEARRQCDIAVRLRPGDAEVRWCLGRILDVQGRHAEAVVAIKKAIDITPKDHRLHKSVASAYLNHARRGAPEAALILETALRECDIALRLQPGDAEAHLIAGQVIEEAAKTQAELPIAGTRKPASRDLASVRYRQALAISPAYGAAALALGSVLAAGGAHGEVAKLADALAAANGDAASVSALRSLATPRQAPVEAPAAQP